MAEETITDSSSEDTGSEETESNESIALVLLVLAGHQNGDPELTPVVWTVLEKKTKEISGKRKGELSLPVETRKIDESTEENLIGSLSEFTGDDDLISSHLQYLFGGPVLKKVFSYKGNPVDLGLLFYEGPLDEEIFPIDQTELEPVGWRTLPSLFAERPDRIREEVLGAVLEFEDVTGEISRQFGMYRERPDLRHPITDILPSSFVTMRAFVEKRELLTDVDIQTRS